MAGVCLEGEHAEGVYGGEGEVVWDGDEVSLGCGV